MVHRAMLGSVERMFAGTHVAIHVHCYCCCAVVWCGVLLCCFMLCYKMLCCEMLDIAITYISVFCCSLSIHPLPPISFLLTSLQFTLYSHFLLSRFPLSLSPLLFSPIPSLLTSLLCSSPFHPCPLTTLTSPPPFTPLLSSPLLLHSMSLQHEESSAAAMFCAPCIGMGWCQSQE